MAETTQGDLERALDRQMGLIDRRLDEQTVALTGHIDGRITQGEQRAGEQIEQLAQFVHDQFEVVDERFDRVDTRLDELEVVARLRSIEVRLDKLERARGAAA